MNNLKLESLIEFASVMAKQNNFSELLRLVIQKASTFLKAETALIMMINPRTHETIKTVYKEGEETEGGPYHFLHTYFSGWVIDKNCGFLSENILKDTRFNTELFEDIQLKSVMCLPLTAEGIIIGTVLLLNKVDESKFTESDYSFLEKLTIIASPYLRDVNKIVQYFTTPLPQQVLLNKYKAHGLLGKSNKFLQLLQIIEPAARCDVRVLLEGKSGTGKEVVAKAIHQCSSRVENKFVAIDCGAIPSNLIESELFGHVKGAFTGANHARIGLIAEADKGTLFLDEVCNLSLDMQAKLLRVLQEGEVRPVGSSKTIKINVRFISASSIPLSDLVEEQKFREDLFFRLMVYPIQIPTLNERKVDIPYLSGHFLNKISKQQNKKAEFFHRDILWFLKMRHWKGNIRELENYVERLVTFAPNDSNTIEVTMLSQKFQEEILEFLVSQKKQNKISLSDSVDNLEKEIILKALEESDWNQSEAARSINIPEQTLRYKMNKFGIKKSG